MLSFACTQGKPCDFSRKNYMKIRYINIPPILYYFKSNFLTSVIIGQTALFQEKIKPEYLGRVFSLTGSIMSFAMPIGLILSGFFADRIGVNHWFLLSGILIIGIAIVCPMITEVRKLDLK